MLPAGGGPVVISFIFASGNVCAYGRLNYERLTEQKHK